MADDTIDVDQTPDPNATAALTQGQGGTTGSATGNAANLNTSGGFDPTSILSTTPNGNERPFDSSANSAMNQDAPSSENNGTVNLNTTRRSNDDIQSNCLDPYIDVEYHITLAIVSQSAVETLRADTVQRANLSPGQYIVFASTAEAQSNQSTDLDYYNIQGLSFTNVVGHTPQNQIVAVIWDAKLRMYEPYGFAFREDIDTMAGQLGYSPSVSPNEYVYRLEIWFSGYDPITGGYNPQIPIPCPRPGDPSSKNKSVVYYSTISAAEAKVSGIGTVYDISLQTFSHYATRAEFLIAHNDTIFKGGITGNKGTTFGSFLEDLATKMKIQIKNDTQKKYDVTYEFVGLKALFDAKFIQDTKINLSTGVNFDPAHGSHATTGHATDIFTIIHNAMVNVQLVRDLLLKENDKGFIEPSVHWNIRTNVKEATNPSGDFNSHSKFTLQFIIEPVLTYRARLPEVTDFNKHVDAGNQKQRIANMYRYGMLLRVYEHLFTSANTEVIDFDYHLKYFYYTPIYYKGVNSMREQDHWTGDLDKARDQKLFFNEAEGSQQTNDVAGPNLNFVPGAADTEDLFSLIGIASNPATSNNKSRPSNTQQYMHRAADVIYANDVSGDAETRKVLTARDQYTRYDMINAKMKIRGDPIWLFNPYISGSDLTPVLAEDQQKDGVFAYAHIDRAVYLRAFAPNQKSFMNPDVSSFRSKRTAIIGGFYQVIKVVNEFSAGQFTQTLDMLKYTHLNYNMFVPVIDESSNNSTINTGDGPSGSDPAATDSLG